MTLIPVDIVRSQDISQIVVLTQSAYDALDTPDPDTLYIVIG